MMRRQIKIFFANGHSAGGHAVVDAENEVAIRSLLADETADDSTLAAIRLDDGTLYVRRCEVILCFLGSPESLPEEANTSALNH